MASISDDSAVYLKHSALSANRNDRNVAYKLCCAANQLAPGEILGVQQIRGLWKIYVRSQEAVTGMISHYLVFDSRRIELFKDDPFLTGSIPSESIIFRDLPLTFDNKHIISHLKANYPEIYLRSNIITGKVRNSNNELTDYLNGDRYIYARQGFAALPKELTIGGQRCRVWHTSQSNKCKRCRMDGHKTESRDCPAYIQVQNDNIIFWESKDVLSNFYPCDMSYADKVFKSSEHAYQYAKLDFLGESEMAAEVLATNTGKQAKLVASRIPYTRLTEWDDHKGSIMRDIIRAKANSCFKFKKVLLDSVDRVIAEGTIDSYWGIGMPPHIAATTNPDFYNGRNILGLVLMEVRGEVAKHSMTTDAAPTSGTKTDSNIEPHYSSEDPVMDIELTPANQEMTTSATEAPTSGVELLVPSVDTEERPTLTTKSPSNVDVEPSSMGDFDHSQPVPGTSGTGQSAGDASVAIHSANGSADDYDVGVPKYSELPPPSTDVLSIAGEIQEADDSDNGRASTPPQVTDAATVLNKCVDSSLKVTSTPSFTTEKKNPTASKSTVRKATPLRRPIAEKKHS